MVRMLWHLKLNLLSLQRQRFSLSLQDHSTCWFTALHIFVYYFLLAAANYAPSSPVWNTPAHTLDCVDSVARWLAALLIKLPLFLPLSHANPVAAIYRGRISTSVWFQVTLCSFPSLALFLMLLFCTSDRMWKRASILWVLILWMMSE